MTLQSGRSDGPPGGRPATPSDPGFPAGALGGRFRPAPSWALALCFLRDAAALGAGVAGIAAFVLVAAGTVAVRLGPSRPDAAGWAVAVLAMAATSATIAAPLGIAAGPALALRAWVVRGAREGPRF
jgi:hypothetical protein